jgi:hypothetical protein
VEQWRGGGGGHTIEEDVRGGPATRRRRWGTGGLHHTGVMEACVVGARGPAGNRGGGGETWTCGPCGHSAGF